MQISKNKIFHWKTESSFELLINGVEFYPRMLDAINQANKFIFVETYFVESGTITTQFLSALIAATKRGVETYVIFDDMGSRNLKEADKILLVQEGVNLCFYHPIKFFAFLNNFYRNHRKLLLVDGQISFVGGAGLSDQFIGNNFWRDNMVAIKGSAVQDWYTLFINNWHNQSDMVIPDFSFSKITNQQFNSLGRLSYTHGYFFNQIKINLLQKIKTSKNRVWLASAYFVPSMKLRRFLSRAAKHGIDIRLIVPGIKTDNYMSRYVGQGYYTKLLKNHVKIYEYQNHFIHSKVVLVDDWVTIGSSNLDRWGAKWNLEANQEIIDKEFSESVYAMFQNDLLSCQEITLEQWQKRAFSKKIKVWFWKQIGKVIALIGLNGRQ